MFSEIVLIETKVHRTHNPDVPGGFAWRGIAYASGIKLGQVTHATRLGCHQKLAVLIEEQLGPRERAESDGGA
jgi:hypothetical protein